MRYLKKFESFIHMEDMNNIDSVERNIRDIFVEYHDLHELVINTVFYEEGIGLPSTKIGSKDNVLEVSLFSQSGISYDDISDEIDMLIDYISSLTDNEVMIYKRLDKNLLFSWMDGFTGIHNTLQLYFVEKVKSRINESLQEDNKIVSDIDDMFVGLKDRGFTYLGRIENSRGFSGVYNKVYDIIIYSNNNNRCMELDWVIDPIEMMREYLSDYFGDIEEFYRISFRVINGTGYSYEVMEYNNIEDIMEYGSKYNINGIKIIITLK